MRYGSLASILKKTTRKASIIEEELMRYWQTDGISADNLPYNNGAGIQLELRFEPRPLFVCTAFYRSFTGACASIMCRRAFLHIVAAKYPATAPLIVPATSMLISNIGFLGSNGKMLTVT